MYFINVRAGIIKKLKKHNPKDKETCQLKLINAILTSYLNCVKIYIQEYQKGAIIDFILGQFV